MCLVIMIDRGCYVAFGDTERDLLAFKTGKQ
jgi:hypothetical protein